MPFLLAGLGNPGSKYARTRHNAGFRVLDAVARQWGAEWKPWQNLGEYAKVSVAGQDIFLLKPSTYMNESGRAVSSLARFYKIPPQNCLICFDEVALPVGQIRLRKNGSAGGQRGMKSVIEQLGTQEIPRLRVGIGPKPEKFDLVNFVLGKFSSAEEELLSPVWDRAVSALETFLSQGIEKAMGQIN
ncbi:MAG: aminoacyl-tRNA hydrolase [Elusimicrobiaceae bacterium]|nr:aminoacyl-tRNA hydrolase [Elusimicrobiaceae bacterium]